MAELGLVAEGIRVERDATPIVIDVDLRAQAGEIVAVLGPNGAGKSTLLRALAGLLPYAGSVRIDGVDARALSVRDRARKLAFVPQQTSLRSALPVREVVAQGRHMHRTGFGSRPKPGHDREVVERALVTCDVANLAERAFTHLSVGEQRRVLIARAIATEARILCLDEPTSSLDVHHVLCLHALLHRLADSGHAVVAVLHPLDDALRYSDRALLLAAGRKVASGPTAEVITPDLIRNVYGVELRHAAALGFSLAPGRS